MSVVDVETASSAQMSQLDLMRGFIWLISAGALSDVLSLAPEKCCTVSECQLTGRCSAVWVELVKVDFGPESPALESIRRPQMGSMQPLCGLWF